MILTVVKRDGRVVGFNEEKIQAAIRKAMIHTEKGEDEQLVARISIPCRCTRQGADGRGGDPGPGRAWADEEFAQGRGPWVYLLSQQALGSP